MAPGVLARPDFFLPESATSVVRPLAQALGLFFALPMPDTQAPAENGEVAPGMAQKLGALEKGRKVKAEKKAARIARGERANPVKAGTKAGVSRDIRVQVLTALNFVGGVKYLARQAEKNPGAFLALVGKCLQQDDGTQDRVTNFVIQQLVISGAPVPGVLASPIAAHVAPLRLVGNGAEVIENESPVIDG